MAMLEMEMSKYEKKGGWKKEDWKSEKSEVEIVWICGQNCVRRCE